VSVLPYPHPQLFKVFKHLIYKTDKSKMACFTFGGKALTYEILVQELVGPIFNPTHHLTRFCLVFLAIVSDLMRKR